MHAQGEFMMESLNQIMSKALKLLQKISTLNQVLPAESSPTRASRLHVKWQSTGSTTGRCGRGVSSACKAGVPQNTTAASPTSGRLARHE